ncbi:MAG: PHD finger domain-containing protein [Candidatus Diapherotrites archaeon]|nr:PHD finger domain-containing protein [Candidatus Diapherotrites archaeon]
MGDGVPRRLRRFERQGLPVAGPRDLDEPVVSAAAEDDSEVSDIVSQIQRQPAPQGGSFGKDATMRMALEEVKKFKERNNRLPEKDEFEQIAENIFAQLSDDEEKKKSAERMERERQRISGKAGVAERAKRGRTKEERAKQRSGAQETMPAEAHAADQGGLAEKEIKDLSIEDLFSEDKGATQKPGEKKKKPSELLDEEFSLAGLGEEGGEDKAADECPNCGASGAEVVYCPGCGTAFCPKCAKGSEQLAGEKKYVCPTCGKKS